MKIRASYYQQFDADYARDVPAEGFGGWKTADIEIAPAHTALVVMHAWDGGAPEEFPGWRRAVEYYPRARKILAEVFPPLLAAVRASPLPVFHVVGGGRDYYSHLPGHRRAVALAAGAEGRSVTDEAGRLVHVAEASRLSQNQETPTPTEKAGIRGSVAPDPVYERLQAFRRERVFVGPHNRADVDAGFARLDFAPEARPAGDEGLAEDGRQLAALCRAHAINHLVYAGFAINWCLLMAPGGMVDMRRHGCLCSTIREAVTAVENRETAREEREKQQALWRVALEFGFVFALEDFVGAVSSGRAE